MYAENHKHFWPFFREHLGEAEPVPEENFGTSSNYGARED